MGPEEGTAIVATGSANSDRLSISSSKMDFPNEESRNKLETAKIPKSGFC